MRTASLTLKPSQTVRSASGKFRLSGAAWCATLAGAASQQWWPSPIGKLTYVKPDSVMLKSQPASPVDVISIVSNWSSSIWANDGFILGGTFPKAILQNQPNAWACLTKFTTPSLQVTYF